MAVPELLATTADLHVRLSFNSWAHERAYVTFDTLAEALAAMEPLG